MTDHNRAGDPGNDCGSGGFGRAGEATAWKWRSLAMALSGVLVLTVAGGWAYGHRTEYGIAYAQLFDEAADACPFGEPACTIATAEEGPACCHADGSCLPEVDLASLIPVEAPKPPMVLSRVDTAAEAPADL